MPPLDSTAPDDNPYAKFAVPSAAPVADNPYARFPVPAAAGANPYAKFGKPSEAGLTPAAAETPTAEQMVAQAQPGAWSDVSPAAGAGLLSGAKEVAAAPAALQGRAPAQPTQQPYYTEPLTFGDFLHPTVAAPKIAYSLSKSVPSLVGGIAGGVAGEAIAPEAGPVGPLVGMAVGAGGVSAVQSLAPLLAEEMQKPGADPDKAFDTALTRAGQEGLFSGASMALFGWAPFKQAAKDMLLQAFVAQLRCGCGTAGRRKRRAGATCHARDGCGCARCHCWDVGADGGARCCLSFGGECPLQLKVRRQSPRTARAAFRAADHGRGWAGSAAR